MFNRFAPAACLALLLQVTLAHGGLILTAEVYDTPGLPGYRTYDIAIGKATSPIISMIFGDSMYLNGDQVRSGITGPIYHDSIDSRVFTSPRDDDNRRDSRFLFDFHDQNFIEFGYSEAVGSLQAVVATRNDSFDEIFSGVPFLRLVTDSPAEVRIHGLLSWRESFEIDTRLSDLPVLILVPEPAGLWYVKVLTLPVLVYRRSRRAPLLTCQQC